jgi:transcriptional regulator with XRE-family HTH domain
VANFRGRCRDRRRRDRVCARRRSTGPGLGLTRDDVAAALGISRSLYAAVEQGKRAAGVPETAVPETAVLAAALHTSVDQVRRALPLSPA